MRALMQAVAVFCLAVWPMFLHAQGRPAGVTTDLVRTEMLAETVSVFGEVVAGRESEVAARVAGIATEMPLRIGDWVSAGDVLARLDNHLAREDS